VVVEDSHSEIGVDLNGSGHLGLVRRREAPTCRHAVPFACRVVRGGDEVSG
jgi:hypothetical protein